VLCLFRTPGTIYPVIHDCPLLLACPDMLSLVGELLSGYGWELISGPDLATRARLLSFNRTQSRVVIGLLTGHNTLRRHLHIMELCNNPTCRKCSTEEETSVHILCECEALASLSLTYLGSLFLDLEDIRELGMGAICNFAKGTGLL